MLLACKWFSTEIHFGVILVTVQLELLVSDLLYLVYGIKPISKFRGGAA